MSKKLQLTIPKPCHENWDGMTPVEKGKFCGSCQKQVVDFSNMSDRAVAEYFKKPSTGSVCGRFMTDQLDRDIAIPKKRIPWVKYFFQFAIPAFLISIKASAQRTPAKKRVSIVAKDTTRRPVFAEQNVTLGMVALPMNLKQFAQDKVIKPAKEPVESIKGEINTIIAADTTVLPAIPPVCSIRMGKIAMPPLVNKNEIEGRVVDEKGEPVPFASIETGKSGQGLVADENGFFKIKRSLLSKGTGLVVSSTGFESSKVIAGEEEYVSGKLYVRLRANVVLQEAVITAYGSHRVRMVMGTYSVIRRNLVVPEIKKPVENILVVYPNPVKSGTELNLSFKQAEEGYYRLQVINQSAQMVHQKEIWIDAEARLLNIEVPSLASGSYFLVLTNKKTGKKLTEKLIIQ